ncbi:hypothetical protein ACOMHN_009472 [Nucella lapillus]
MQGPLRTVVGHCGLLVLLGAGFGLMEFVGAQDACIDHRACSTPECQKAANQLKAAMDASVDPCEDFFEYACGAWRRDHPVPNSQETNSQFYVLSNEIDVDIVELLTGRAIDSQPEVFRKVKVFFDSCNNAAAIDRVHDRPLITLLNDLGGWPMFDSGWTAENFDLTDTLVKMGMYANMILFQAYPLPDESDATKATITVRQPTEFILGKRNAYTSKDVQLYVNASYIALRNVLKTMGRDDSSETLAEEMENIVNFEFQLVKLTVSRAKELKYEGNKRFTLANMDAEFPGMIEWSRLFRGLFENSEVIVTLDDNEPIFIKYPPFLTSLQTLLASTDKKTIANTLMWSVAKSSLFYLSPFFQGIYMQMEKVLSGKEVMKHRPLECAYKVRKLLGPLVGKPYVDNYVQGNTNQEVRNMIEELKKAFRQQVTALDWMDQQTKDKAKEKIDAIQSIIGCSNNIMDVDYMTDIYQNFNFGNSFFDNKLIIDRQNTINVFKKLREVQDVNNIFLKPVIVNALYWDAKITMGFTSGIMQSPFFNPNFPKYMNYGGLATVIGHELTHGFDHRGRHYDKLGNKNNWWTNATDAKFTEKEQCFVDQYNGFLVPEAGVHMNGEFTKDENIADNGGIRQAFRAYKNWVEQNNCEVEDKVLPGLDLSPDQLFFLSHAQVWCQNLKPESAMNTVANDRHTPQRFRVIGALQNFEEFSNAFNCTPTAYMNPPSKCVIW